MQVCIIDLLGEATTKGIVQYGRQKKTKSIFKTAKNIVQNNIKLHNNKMGSKRVGEFSVIKTKRRLLQYFPFDPQILFLLYVTTNQKGSTKRCYSYNRSM